jgi:hypothetical protein
MNRACAGCGRPYDARSARSRFCSQRCQKRAYRAGVSSLVALPRPEQGASDYERALRAELEAAGALDTFLGVLAMTLAYHFVSPYETASGLVALSKELSRVLAEIRAPAPTPDVVDEMSAHRDRKQLRAVRPDHR